MFLSYVDKVYTIHFVHIEVAITHDSKTKIISDPYHGRWGKPYIQNILRLIIIFELYCNIDARREFPVPVHQPAVLCVQGMVLIQYGNSAHIVSNCKGKLFFHVSKPQICDCF